MFFKELKLTYPMTEHTERKTIYPLSPGPKEQTKKKISLKTISKNKINKVGRESDHASGYTLIIIKI